MAFVRLSTTGIETRHEAIEIGGVDRRFQHPLSRYVENPYVRDTWEQNPRTRLPKRLAMHLVTLDRRLSHDSRLSRRMYFRDLWDGESHSVRAATVPHVQHNVQKLSRLALVTHTLTDSEGDRKTNEILLQRHDGGNWQTVAAIASSERRNQQYGFVDPDQLPAAALRSEERFNAEADDFLTELVVAALWGATNPSAAR